MRARVTVRARRRVLAIAAALVALYLAVLSGQRALDGYRARQELAAVEREIAGLRQQNVTLQAELDLAMSDAEIERQARSQLGLVKPGDRPLVLIWPEGTPTPAAAPTPTAAVEPRWRAWVRVFFDLE